MRIESDKCLVCGKCAGVMQLASGCQLLAGNECLKKHNNVLMFLTTTWVGWEERIAEKMPVGKS